MYDVMGAKEGECFKEESAESNAARSLSTISTKWIQCLVGFCNEEVVSDFGGNSFI